jgi:hypothetical protein
MNTFSLVFSIIGIAAMVFLVAAGPTIATHQAFAYGGYGDFGGYPPYAYCSYADYKKNVLSYGDCGYYPFGY